MFLCKVQKRHSVLTLLQAVKAIKSEMIEKKIWHIASGEAYKRHTARLTLWYSVLTSSLIKIETC